MFSAKYDSFLIRVVKGSFFSPAYPDAIELFYEYFNRYVHKQSILKKNKQNNIFKRKKPINQTVLLQLTAIFLVMVSYTMYVILHVMSFYVFKKTHI